MRKTIPLMILLVAFALSAFSQSGRRVNTSRAAPAAPIQPPLNPEPEITPKPVILISPLLFLPSGIRERQINAIDSGSFRFEDFHGKVVVINIWASWCGPCRREVPEYEKVRKAYLGTDVEFIGLTTENPRTDTARVKRFLRDVNFSFRLGWADREMADFLMNGKDGIPQTLVINADNRVVDHWSGYSPGRSGDKLKRTIDHALQIAQ